MKVSKKRVRRLWAGALAVLMMAVFMFSDVCPAGISEAAAQFTPRKAAPNKANAAEYKYYWGDNPYPEGPHFEINNCTKYAFGRAYELLGYKPAVWAGHAGVWFNSNDNSNFQRISDHNAPRLGAIMCWSGNTYGHVAVVEAIDGSSITFSESSYPDKNTGHPGFGWRLNTKDISELSQLGYGTFQGYMYLPVSFQPTPTIPEGTPIPSGPQCVSDGDYFIVSALEGDRFNPGKKCLTIGGLPALKDTNGANAELWSVYGNAGHVFTVMRLENGFYKIKLKDSKNSYLDVGGDMGKVGGNVQLWGGYDHAVQEWRINETDDGDGFTLQSRYGGNYLDVEAAYMADGTNIRLFVKDPKTGKPYKSEKWYFIPYGGGSAAKQEMLDGEYQIVPKLAPDKALSAAGNGVAVGTNVQLESTKGDGRHTFQVRWLGGGYYELINKNSGLALDVSEGLSKNGANVQLWTNFDEYNKKWLIRSSGDGYFNVISKCNGLYLDLAGAKTENGTNLQVCVGWGMNGGDYQRWRFVPFDRTVPVSSVTLSQTTLALTEGAKSTLTATVSPTNATDNAITWRSDNASVAVVDSSGAVTAKSAGTAIITVTSSNGKSASCSVTVSHAYKATWNADASKHWKECACGSKAENAEHIFAWFIDREPTVEREGIRHEECRVCAYRRNENTPIAKLPAPEVPKPTDPTDPTDPPGSAEPTTGCVISGKAVSFREQAAKISIELLDGSGHVVASTFATGNSASYRLENVAPGSYTLRVSKANHVAREYPVTTGGKAAEVNAEIWLRGDVNGDGRLDAKDKKILFNMIANGVRSGYAFQAGDLDGSGRIDAKDKKQLFNHIAGIASLWR